MIKFGVVMYNSVINFECPKETLVKQVCDAIRIFDARYDHELTYDNKVLVPTSTLYEMGIQENGIINVIRVNQGSFDMFAKTIYGNVPKVIQTTNQKIQRLPIVSISNIDGLARNAIIATQDALHDNECLRIAIREAFATNKSILALNILEKHDFAKLTPEEMNYVTDTVERYFIGVRYKIDAIITEIKNSGKLPQQQVIQIYPEVLIQPSQTQSQKVSQKNPPNQSQPTIEKNSQRQHQGPIIILPHLEPRGQFPFEVPTKFKNSK